MNLIFGINSDGMYESVFLAEGVNTLQLSRQKKASLTILRSLPGENKWFVTYEASPEASPLEMLSLLSWGGAKMEWKIISPTPIQGKLVKVS